jgi:hypothetical protein
VHVRRLEEEPRDIPERLLEPWRTAQRPAPSVTAGEFLEVLATLSPPHVANLNYQFHQAGMAPPFTHELLLSRVGPAPRRVLLAGQAVEGEKLDAPTRLITSRLPFGDAPTPSPELVRRELRLEAASPVSVADAAKGGCHCTEPTTVSPEEPGLLRDSGKGKWRAGLRGEGAGWPPRHWHRWH